MKWLKKIFGVKDKEEEKPSKSYIPKDLELEERNISPLLTEEKQSVPIEENIMDIVQPEEPIVPTLQVYDDEKLESKIDYKEPTEKDFDGKEMKKYLGDEYGQFSEPKPLSKKKSTKPKKQAKKKDNFNDDASKPKGRNFLM